MAAEPIVPAEPLDGPIEEQGTNTDLGWTFSGLLIVLAYVLSILAFLMFARFDAADFIIESWMFLLPGLIFVAVLGGLSRPWTHLVGGITASIPALVVLFLFMAFPGLIDPTRGIESQAVYLLTLALLWALPAAFIGFFLGRKRKDQRVRGAMGRTHGRYALGVGMLFAGLFLASILATVAADGQDDAYDFEADRTVRIDLADFQFEPRTITLTVGEITEIIVDNNDGAFHTFTYKVGSTTYDHHVPGGETTSFLVRFTEEGDYAFWCTPHSGEDTRGDYAAGEDSDDMAGVFVVESAA